MANALRPSPRSSPRGPRRRGSIYAMVLGVTMLITVIGLGALATSRVTSRAAGVSNDWLECGATAFSAAEHAVAKLNAECAASPDAWRGAYTDGAAAFTGPFGRGELIWFLEDEDHVFNDDYADPIKLSGIGKIGTTKRVYSVTLNPAGEGVEALKTAVHSSGTITLGGTTVVLDGPVSTNGNLVNAANLRGGFATEVAGTGGTAAPAKPLPSGGAFDLYVPRATRIASSAAGTGSIDPNTLTATASPYGTPNAEGIYHLRLPETIAKLTIMPSRIKGTLLIEAAAGQTNQVLEVRGGVFWQPHTAQLPTLITKGLAKVTFTGSTADYSDGSGSYPSEMRGLIHATCNVDLTDGAFIRGCLIADGVITTAGTVGFSATPSLYDNPPLGYTKGNRLAIVPGTWKWDAPPAGM